MHIFNRKIFFKYCFLIIASLAIIFNIAMIFFGYELMPFDIPGSILTAVLLAHLLMLLGLEQEEEKL